MIGLGLGYTLPGKGSAPEAPTDTTAPSITSANPSGSYVEGQAIGGTVLPNETATISVIGIDAAAVTLDPDTGVWSLEATVFATKASYSFSFIATDAADNASDPQVVAITITEAAAATAPALTLTSAAGTNPMSWESEYTDLVIGSDYICCRWRVDGGAWTDEANVLFDSDFFMDHGIDEVSHEWPLFAAAAFNAGELVEVQEGILRSGTTAWSDTLSDTMAASDVTFSYGDKATSATSSTAISFAAATFAGGGRALIFLTGWSNAGGTTDSLPASITITPSAGGAAINCTSLGEGGKAAGRAFAIYLSDSDVSAGNYDITGTRPAAARSNVIMWGTLVGASATPTTAATFTSGSSMNPHITSSLTCVANGLLIGAIMLEHNVTLAANTGTTLHDQTFFNSEVGLCVGSRADTGPLSFDATPNGTYNWGKGIVAFGPV